MCRGSATVEGGVDDMFSAGRGVRLLFGALPALLSLVGATAAAAAEKNGPLPPLFPRDNWWNVDISSAPLDPQSTAFIGFIGTGRQVHPDFGGVNPDDPPDGIYGIPYGVVTGTQARKTVEFDYADESDGVDHATGLSFPFYPIPDEAITQPHWIEGGQPGNQDVSGDRHMLIVDTDNKHLYELYALHHDGTRWRAGSGAFFDLTRNDRRPEGWTSADAAGLAILPGLVRYDEVYGPNEIEHALRVTVRATNGYVFPASHRAGSNASALPMGARLRLKTSRDLSSFPAPAQKIFRALKKYGLIVADNGSDLYVSGAFDARWDNSVLNPAFHALKASDFEVVQLGYRPATARPQAVWHPFFAVDSRETPFVGDFDGDGRTDIITFTRQNPSALGDVYVALSNGLQFVDQNGTPGRSDKWHDWFAISRDEQVVIGDYDGDGRDDIATWLATTTRQVYVALSRGTAMGPEAEWVSSIGATPSDVLASGDANGDGRSDLVLFARTQGKVYVALSEGNRFTAPTLWHGFFAVSTYERPRVADVTGDRRADIVTFATDSPTAFGDVYVATSDGTKFVGLNGAPNASSKWHDWFAIRPEEQVRVGDLDGDGQDDFFTFLPPPFAQCYTVLSQGAGMGPNVLWREAVAPLSSDIPYVGDANRDGKADIILFAQSEGKVYVSLAP